MRSGKEIREVEVESTIEIDLTVDAFIPVSYISSSVQRIMVYKRLSSASERRAIDEIAEELEDRYGSIPLQCRTLFEIVEIRQAAKQLGVSSIAQKNDTVSINFSDYKTIKPEKFSKIDGENDYTVKLGNGKKFSIVINNFVVNSIINTKKLKNVLQALI